VHHGGAQIGMGVPSTLTTIEWSARRWDAKSNQYNGDQAFGSSGFRADELNDFA
jgi:hypothetical protein